MAGIVILKYMHDLSDEALCARWIENPYYQYFCGEEFFQHVLVFDRSSMTRWRQRMGEEKLVALVQESLAAATRAGGAKPADFAQVIQFIAHIKALPDNPYDGHTLATIIPDLEKQIGVSLQRIRSSRSSATPKTSTAWIAITSPDAPAIAPTPCSPAPATISPSCSTG